MRTYVLEGLSVLIFSRKHWVYASHDKLHLEVISLILRGSYQILTYLQTLNLALETLDEILHVLAVEAVFLLLLRRLGSLRLLFRFN